MSLKVLGILGGMGPQATVALQQLIIDGIDANDDRDHIPLLVDVNTQVPSRIDYLIHGKGENPGPILTLMAQRLEAAGAKALAMPCNTAHLFAADIIEGVSIPFLNMIELTRRQLLTDDVKRVGILASPAVKASALFDNALNENGIDVIWPENMAEMLEIIQIIKRDGVNQALFERFQQSANGLIDNGADAILIGCSEFSLFASFWTQNVYDSLSILAAAIIKFSKNS